MDINYTRCPKCSYVYDSSLGKCPNCANEQPISEKLENEVVFNIND